MTSGRREANKVRTREAIVAAVYDLLATEPLEALTAERVADAADVSRRTFFNYFPSVEAVVACRAEEVLDELRAALAARPATEPLLDGAKAVVAELFTVDELTHAASAWRAVQASPGATRYVLAANEEYATELAAEWTRLRLSGAGEPEPLVIAVLTGACMAAFHAARHAWLTSHPGPVDAAARDDFVALVHRAFDLLRPLIPTGTTEEN